MDTSKATAAASRKPRRMRTNAEKRRIVEEAMIEEVSVAEVARRHEINANLLFNWRKLYQQGRLDHGREPAAKLLAVQVASAASEPVEANLPPSRPGTIEIVLPGDIRVRVQGRADTVMLAEVMAVLRSR